MNDLGPKKPKGEQFSDPLAWNPDRPPGPPINRSRVGGDPTDKREREINRKILREYGGGPFDAIKPFIAAGLVGMIVFSQVDRTHMLNAVIYTVMATMSAGAVYVMILRDTLPPLISIIFRGCFVLGVLAVIGWFIINGSDTFKPSGDEERQRRQFRVTSDPAKD